MPYAETISILRIEVIKWKIVSRPLVKKAVFS